MPDPHTPRLPSMPKKYAAAVNHARRFSIELTLLAIVGLPLLWWIAKLVVS